MSLTWTMDKPAYMAPPKLTPWWYFVFSFMVLFILWAVSMYLVSPETRSAITGKHWQEQLLVPVFACVVLGCSLITGYEEDYGEYAWWNALCDEHAAAWQYWAREHLWLLQSAAIAPEDMLAERMLGLEGAAPVNPGKALPLHMDASHEGSREEIALERLLQSMRETLHALGRSTLLEVLLQAGPDTESALRRVWKRLELPESFTLRQVAPDGTWLIDDALWAEGNRFICRLLIACQWQDRDGAAPACTESAVALLLCHPRRAHEQLPRGLKPQARVFRPIEIEPDTVSDALATLLQVEQVPRGKIHHAWLSGLNKPLRHATAMAIREEGLNATLHDLDYALGLPGPANASLLQALAGQMVSHGQGAQMVVAPSKTGALLYLLADRHKEVQWPEPANPRLLAYSILFLVLFIYSSVMVRVKLVTGHIDNDIMYGFAAACLLMVVMQVGVAIWNRRQASREFLERYY